MTKQLITGGAGFIGFHLARYLADRGDEVHLLDDLSRGRVDADLEGLLKRPNVRLIEADLSDPAALDRVEDGYAGVYHLAAVIGVRNVMERPYDVLAVNSRTVLNLLDWFGESRSGKLLFSSTSEAYAWTATFHTLPIPTPEEVPLSVDSIRNRRASYSLSKVFGEMAVVHACERAGKPYAIVRYHNVYGPRMGMQHVIPELYRRVYDGEDPLVVYSVDHTRAFCYVADAVDATVRLMEVGAPSDVYNVGNDQGEITIGALAREVLAIGGGGEREIVPRAGDAPGIVRRSPDISRLRNAIAFEPRFDLRGGLEPTLAWYRDYFEGLTRPGAADRPAQANSGAVAPLAGAQQRDSS